MAHIRILGVEEALIGITVPGEEVIITAYGKTIVAYKERRFFGGNGGGGINSSSASCVRSR